jgi:hypothetical protein
MNATQLSFNGLGNSFAIVWDEIISGEAAELQRAVVNIETRAGSDLLVSDHGTTLIAAALSGAASNAVSAQHACNFAAIDTLFFLATTGYDDMPEMSDLTILPTLGSTSRLAINLQASFK